MPLRPASPPRNLARHPARSTRPARTTRHVDAAGFGSSLETHTSDIVTGPWRAGATLAQCDLPTADPKAFCAGPVVHPELADPTRKGELVVSYGVGTTATPPSVAGTLSTTYWTRLAWTSTLSE